MFSSVQALSSSMNNFSRAMSAGLRSFADLAQGENSRLRGIEEIGNAQNAGANRTANQSGTLMGQADTSSEDPAVAIAEILAAKNQVKAAIHLVRADDETLGSLLDIVG